MQRMVFRITDADSGWVCTVKSKCLFNLSYENVKSITMVVSQQRKPHQTIWIPG